MYVHNKQTQLTQCGRLQPSFCNVTLRVLQQYMSKTPGKQQDAVKKARNKQYTYRCHSVAHSIQERSKSMHGKEHRQYEAVSFQGQEQTGKALALSAAKTACYYGQPWQRTKCCRSSRDAEYLFH